MNRDWFDSAFGDGFLGGILGLGSSKEPPDSIPLRILGVDAIPAYDTALQAAFRRRVMELHPDLGAYTALPGMNDAVLAVAQSDSSVQEAKWARDVLLRKVARDPAAQPPKLPQRPEHAAFDAARKAVHAERQKRNEEIRAERAARAAARAAARELSDSLDVTAERSPPQPGDGGDRRRVTRGCADCGKRLELGEEVWQVRVYVERSWPRTRTVRRFCADCGPRQHACRGWWGKQPGKWRSRCSRCDRPIVRVDSPDYYCTCPEPRFMPYPVPGHPDAQKCVLCGDWPMPLEDWSCSAACRKALRRAETREPIPERKCEQCRELLDGGRADARYCSPACRQKAYRERRSGG